MTRATTLALVGLLGCNANFGGQGTGSVDLNSGTSTGSADTTTGVVDSTTSGGTNITVGPPADTTTSGAPETDGSSSSSSTSDDGTTTGGPLIDPGLLARWYIDEADMGQAIVVLADDAPEPVDLSIVYDGADPQFGLDGSNRGLLWMTVGNDGRAIAPIVGTKIESVLTTSTAATIELVLNVKAVSGMTSRFFHIGTGNTNGDLVVGADTMDALEIRWGGASQIYFDAALDGTRQVVHVVIDTNQVSANDRIRAFIDGTELTIQSGTGPALGSPIPLQSSSSLTLGNRTDGHRSFAGALQYAAIYRVALSPADVADNAAVLDVMDDP